ncbi:hypothetical protein GcM1_007001 [Golovinomyces cichoracearum]|uniref:Uncharacterized protein n=1 Tax=Golovinomyces cichoracearum TaxID=62708 RepID=A0A420JCU4_9PEZI|nr:hypothetical protein GcM1_007001 [Golovinomyces cichoracearum]
MWLTTSDYTGTIRRWFTGKSVLLRSILPIPSLPVIKFLHKFLATFMTTRLR